MAKRYPPGPRSLIGANLAREMSRDVFGFSMRLARQYGDVVSFRCGPIRFFQFAHPDQFQEVLVREAKRFHKPRRLKQVLGRWDGEGLVLSDGDLWIRQRRLVQQAFQPRRIASYAADMVRITGEMLDRWNDCREVDIVDELHRTTLDIVCKTLFGVDVADHSEIRHTVQTLQETALVELGRLVPLPDWLPLASKRRLRGAIDYMQRLLDGIIERRRATREDAGDLLSMLLLSVDEEGDGRGMSDQQARDETMTLLLAGHETTATSLVWACYLLASHPEIQDARLGRSPKCWAIGRPWSRTCRTSRRSIACSKRRCGCIRPSISHCARRPRKSRSAAGGSRPAARCIYSFTRRTTTGAGSTIPKSFGPSASPGYEQRLPQCAYIPFGAGPRVCIGRGMATMEATLVLAGVLQRYRLSLAPDWDRWKWRRRFRCTRAARCDWRLSGGRSAREEGRGPRELLRIARDDSRTVTESVVVPVLDYGVHALSTLASGKRRTTCSTSAFSFAVNRPPACEGNTTMYS